MKKFPIILFAVLALGVLSVMARGHRSHGETPEERKADYIFLEALRAKSQGHHDAAFALLHRAHELNGRDKEIGVELSTYLLRLSQIDSAMLDKSMSLLRDYCEEAPADIFYGSRYALLNEQLLNRDEAVRTWRRLHLNYPDRLDVTYRYADVLGQGGTDADRDHAIAIYDSVEVAEGKSIPLSSKKIQLYYTRQDTASILAEADSLRASSPKNVDYQVFSGDIYSMFKLNDRAKEFYDRACELDPSSGLAYYSRARFYNSLGDSAAFNREVFQALRQKSLDVETKLAILRSYIQEMYNDSTQLPQVRQLFDVLIDQHPHEHDIHALYARYLIVTKDYAKAAEQTERSLDLDPADGEEWEMLTSLYLQVDDMDKAKAAIKRSFRYFPENPRQYLALGSIYTMAEEGEKAAKEYGRALELTDSTDVEMLSRIYGAIGDNYYTVLAMPDSAFAMYQKSLLYDPDNTLALNNCAYYLACEGRDLDKALSMAETAVAAEPENENSLDTYAWVLFKLKNYSKAREIIDRTLSLSDEPGKELLEHAGDIYFMDGEPDKALEFWKEALKLDPDNALLEKKVKHKTYFFK